MSTKALRRWVLLAGVGAGSLVAVVAVNSTRWNGATYPGFLVMANRVVASIVLPDWKAANPEALFQHQVLAVDGVPAKTAEAVYSAVRDSSPGTVHRYLVRSSAGRTFTVEAPARRFSGKDYVLLFGAYLMNGIAFFATGLLVIWLKPGSAAGFGLFSQCLITGVFVVTAADLYGPYCFFRLHVVAESLLTAGFIHLALVFPTDRLRGRRMRALLAVYLPFTLLAAAYELNLASPSAYTALHLTASAAHGLGALAIITAVVYDLLTTRSPLVRRRVSVVALGTLAAFALPGVLMAASAILGGRVALNAGAFTAFLFPLSLGYAVVKQDLFEIDVVLRRAATYAFALVAITVLYLTALFLIEAMMPISGLSQSSPVAIAVLNLAILFLIAPIKARAQDTVDRLFYRKGYDAQRALSDLSHALSTVHTLGEVVQQTSAMVSETLGSVMTEVLLTDDGASFRWANATEARRDGIRLHPDLAARLGRGSIAARYEWDDGSGRSLPAVWRDLDAEVLVPIRSGWIVIGALALGPRISGRPYGEHDARFLAAAASQVGLAITNARAFNQLAELNASLEDQVRERTAALEAANRDLNRSYAELRRAYEQLEQNQTSLMRADRLATLGRLAAGIAHEVNTPLGAVLSSLKIISDLGREYQESTGDPDVSEGDHREIASEIVATAQAAAGWARKAAAFITKVKAHGREPRPVVRDRFAVRAVVDETRALLAQRLRVASCELCFEDEPEGITLVGDPARLEQVLLNLVTNALDAYEDTHAAEGRIEVTARATEDAVTLRVRDWAGGMPPAIATRIFDELYTTKDPGRGTGLGLWIARNLVEDSFAGTLTVETEVGVGSCFVISAPPRTRP